MFNSMLKEEDEAEGLMVSSRLLVFLVLGIALLFIGIVVLVVASASLCDTGSVSVVIFVGPFPIVFGSGPDATWLIIMGVILAIISLIAFLAMNKRYGRLSN